MCSVGLNSKRRHFSIQSNRVCSCGGTLSCSMVWTCCRDLHSGQETWLEARVIHYFFSPFEAPQAASLVLVVQTPGTPCASGYPLICHRHFSAIPEASIYPICSCSTITQHGQESRSGFLLTTREDRICSDSGLRIGMGCLQGKSGHEGLESSCSWDLIPRYTVEVAWSLNMGKVQRQQQYWRK